MTIEGIWTGEVYGPFGWDNRGIFVLENGRIVGGDNRQYSTGSYTLSGDNVIAELTVHYYGPPRTVFGEAREEYTIELAGRLEKNLINGSIRRVDKPQYDLQLRLTKRLDLPRRQ